MLQKFATVALLGVALSVAACNTVRGAASDVNSVANCTENAMNGGNCGSRSASRQTAVRTAMIVPDA